MFSRLIKISDLKMFQASGMGSRGRLALAMCKRKAAVDHMAMYLVGMSVFILLQFIHLVTPTKATVRRQP